MNRINFTGLTVVIGLLALGGSAMAEVQKPLLTPRGAMDTKMQSNNSTTANSNGLYKPVPSMRIARGAGAILNLKLPAPDKPIPSTELLVLAINTWKDKANRFRESHHVAMNKERECKDRSYSQADQAAAGCRNNEPMSECNTKLIKWCAKVEFAEIWDAQISLSIAKTVLREELDKFKTSLGRW